MCLQKQEEEKTISDSIRFHKTWALSQLLGVIAQIL